MATVVFSFLSLASSVALTSVLMTGMSLNADMAWVFPAPMVPVNTNFNSLRAMAFPSGAELGQQTGQNIAGNRKPGAAHGRDIVTGFNRLNDAHHVAGV